MRNKLYIVLLFAPLACASEPVGDFSDSATDTDGSSGSAGTTGAETDSGSAGTGSGTQTSGGTGSSATETGTESGSTTQGGTGTSSAGTGSTGPDSSSSGAGSTSGDSTGGTTGGVGGQKFPGDPCDPFIDECVDAGGNYECHWDYQVNQNMEVDVYFQCAEINETLGNGTYGEQCGVYQYECVTGLGCSQAVNFPAGDCDHANCCRELCVYEEDCGAGKECAVFWWQSDLSDYLDPYIGIGQCEL